MKKSFIVPALVFVILAGGLYYLLTNAHVDLFTGSIKKFDNFELKENVVQANISLLDVSRGDATLDAGGWAMAIGIIGGIPLVIAMLIRSRIKRKERKRLAAIHASSVPNETTA